MADNADEHALPALAVIDPGIQHQDCACMTRHHHVQLFLYLHLLRRYYAPMYPKLASSSKRYVVRSKLGRTRLIVLRPNIYKLILHPFQLALVYIPHPFQIHILHFARPPSPAPHRNVFRPEPTTSSWKLQRRRVKGARGQGRRMRRKSTSSLRGAVGFDWSCERWARKRFHWLRWSCLVAADSQ